MFHRTRQAELVQGKGGPSRALLDDCAVVVATLIPYRRAIQLDFRSCRQGFMRHCGNDGMLCDSLAFVVAASELERILGHAHCLGLIFRLDATLCRSSVAGLGLAGTNACALVGPRSRVTFVALLATVLLDLSGLFVARLVSRCKAQYIKGLLDLGWHQM